ncbi:MAG: PAS domain-containing protein [Cyanobacteria bacterium P01_C01_bin.121]
MITADHSTNHAIIDDPSTLNPIAVYDAVWNDLQDGMYALAVLEEGADFRFIAFNQAVVKYSILPTQDLIGKRLSEALPPERVERYCQHYNQCWQTGETVVFEEQLSTPAGETWWYLNIYPIRDSLGKIHQLLVSATDITQKKRTEIKLAESKQLLQEVIDAIPAIIVWKDRESNFLGCNRPFLSTIHEKDPTAVIGKTDYDMPWKREESDWFRECDRQVMENNEPQLNIIEPQLQVGGRQAWLSTSKIPLHDEDGIVTGILVIVEDITDRKEAKDQQARLLDILEATPDIVGITDASGRHQYLNQAGQQTFNTSSEQVQCLQLTDLTSPETAEMLISKALPVAREQGIWSGESIICNWHGQKVPVSHVIIGHKSDSGLTERYSSIMRDISDRKEAELQLTKQSEELSDTLTQLKKTQAQIIQSEKMSSLGQMVAGVAHEINNPVNFIHGNLQPACTYTKELLNLLDLYGKTYPATPDIENAKEAIDIDFVKEDLPKLLSSMSMGTKRIREIVLSLRNFSRLDESEIKTVDIHEGIDSTLVILNHRLKTDNSAQPIEVINQYGELPRIDCYPSQLNQVLMNILSNAIDALVDHPAPCITITTEAQGDLANIRIDDNGTGIPKEIQSQILNPFFTTKAVGKGTGMGMSISYQIITEKHGGQLTFASEEGQGTKFSISIPIKQPPRA